MKKRVKEREAWQEKVGEFEHIVKESKQYQLEKGLLQQQFASERSAYETMIVQLKNQIVE